MRKVNMMIAELIMVRKSALDENLTQGVWCPLKGHTYLIKPAVFSCNFV